MQGIHLEGKLTAIREGMERCLNTLLRVWKTFRFLGCIQLPTNAPLIKEFGLKMPDIWTGGLQMNSHKPQNVFNS